jgi:hypothetical protein
VQTLLIRPIRPPKKLPIDLNEIKTRQGSWRILVESVVDTQAGFNLFVKMILEQTSLMKAFACEG